MKKQGNKEEMRNHNVIIRFYIVSRIHLYRFTATDISLLLIKQNMWRSNYRYIQGSIHLSQVIVKSCKTWKHVRWNFHIYHSKASKVLHLCVPIAKLKKLNVHIPNSMSEVILLKSFQSNCTGIDIFLYK